MNSLISKYFILPKEATAVELRHVQRINRIALGICLAHVPLFCLVAWLCGTSMNQALVFGTLLVIGPALASVTLRNPRTLSLVFGFTSMSLGALLVHLGQGPMQIEMHFHFFAALALLTVWGNPLIIWIATITVAVHHGLFWLLLPESVFNYEASLWVVVVHATFVVVEAVAASFIARNFFDNVIGLEKIVESKTQQLRHRSEDMKKILDNTAQGFMTVAMDGSVESERSTILSTWLGTIEQQTVFELFGRIDRSFVAQLQLGWEALSEDLMPIEVTLDQLPKKLVHGIKTLGFEYRPILAGNKVEKILLVISDLTSQIERERIERSQKETMTIFEKLNRDRIGFLEFFDEGTRLVTSIVKGTASDEVETWRTVHTLKGICCLFGVTSLADLCHAIEDHMAKERGGVTSEHRLALRRSWNDLSERLKAFLGDESRIHVGESDLLEALAKLRKGATRDELERLLTSWHYEPLKIRFGRLAEQASAVAERLGKQPIEIVTEDHGLRLPQQTWASFWSAFSHAIRNAVDHGIETPEKRRNSGKSQARIKLSTQIEQERLILSIEDNGQGIDWEVVKRKAEACGMPAASRQELTEALFSDGFSTKSEATAFSGRGVGMGSLRQECLNLGGSIELVSEHGKGTRLVFSFPLASMLESETLATVA